MFHQCFLFTGSTFISSHLSCTLCAIHAAQREHARTHTHIHRGGSSVCEKYTHNFEANPAYCPAKTHHMPSQEHWNFRVSEGMLCGTSGWSSRLNLSSGTETDLHRDSLKYFIMSNSLV